MSSSTGAVKQDIVRIKDKLGFRQFSLRGEVAATGEWLLVCLAFNITETPRRLFDNRTVYRIVPVF